MKGTKTCRKNSTLGHYYRLDSQQKGDHFHLFPHQRWSKSAGVWLVGDVSYLQNLNGLTKWSLRAELSIPKPFGQGKNLQLCSCASLYRNRTKSIDVTEISRDIYTAERAQEQAKDDLETGSRNAEATRNQVADVKSAKAIHSLPQRTGLNSVYLPSFRSTTHSPSLRRS